MGRATLVCMIGVGMYFPLLVMHLSGDGKASPGIEAAVLALLTLLSAHTGHFLGRPWHPGRAERVAMMIALAPVLCSWADFRLNVTVRCFAPGSGDDFRWMLVGLPLVAGPILVQAFVGSPARPHIARAHRLALVTVGAAMLLWAAALVRCARYPGHLQMDAVVRRVPQIGELPPLRKAPSEYERLELAHEVAGLHVSRQCTEWKGSWYCSVWIDGGSSKVFAVSWPCWSQAPLGVDDVVAVRRTPDGHVLLFDVGGSLQAAIRTNDSTLDVRLRDLAPWLAPSPWAVAAAALGLAVAAHHLSRRRIAAARHARLLAGREGVLREDGWVDFADGSDPRRVETSLPPGPVVVLAVAAQGPAYRDRADLEIEAGTKAALLEPVIAELVERDAIAAVAALLPTAPLVAAAYNGMLF